MGNRAVITTEKKDVGVYLHWNGGRDSVRPFLMYCKMKGYRALETDSYGYARLCQVIGNFFGGDTSIGVARFEETDSNNFDNGTYIVKDWKIVDRLHFEGTEQSEYDPLLMLFDIDKEQPEKEQLGYEKIITMYNELVEEGY